MVKPSAKDATATTKAAGKTPSKSNEKPNKPEDKSLITINNEEPPRVGLMEATEAAGALEVPPANEIIAIAGDEDMEEDAPAQPQHIAASAKPTMAEVVSGKRRPVTNWAYFCQAVAQADEVAVALISELQPIMEPLSQARKEAFRMALGEPHRLTGSQAFCFAWQLATGAAPGQDANNFQDALASALNKLFKKFEKKRMADRPGPMELGRLTPAHFILKSLGGWVQRLLMDGQPIDGSEAVGFLAIIGTQPRFAGDINIEWPTTLDVLEKETEAPGFRLLNTILKINKNTDITVTDLPYATFAAFIHANGRQQVAPVKPRIGLQKLSM